MTLINLCFKPLMLQSELSSWDFTALFLSASSSTGGLSGSRTGREAPASLMGHGNTWKGHVLPNFLPPQFTAYNPDNPGFCFSVGFLFLANWVPEEGENTPNSMLEVIGCGVAAQHEAKVSPTKPLLGAWYLNPHMQISFLHWGLDLSCLPSTQILEPQRAILRGSCPLGITHWNVQLALSKMLPEMAQKMRPFFSPVCSEQSIQPLWQ